MAGRMGNVRVTIQNLEVIKADKDNNILVLKGSVPGPKGNLLVVRKAKKKAKVLPKIKPIVKKKKEVQVKQAKVPAGKPAVKK
jgi:large subunit ribosomal protein L3